VVNHQSYQLKSLTNRLHYDSMDNMRDEVSVQWPGKPGTQACRAVAFLSSVSSVAFLSSVALAKEEAKVGLRSVVLTKERKTLSNPVKVKKWFAPLLSLQQPPFSRIQFEPPQSSPIKVNQGIFSCAKPTSSFPHGSANSRRVATGS
jgi:hypothetical protein